MPGPSNASNRLGSASYIVGTPANGLGNGVNFTSIQAAVNQAVADGFGPANPVDVVIRAGVYTEDVTITDGGISLVGVSDAPPNLLGQQTFIDGTISLVITGINQFALSNLFVRGVLGPALSVTGGGNTCKMSADNCTFSSSAAATPGVSFTNASGTFGLATFTNCSLTSSLAEAHFSSARTISVFFSCNLRGATNMVTLDGTARVQLLYSVGSANAGFGVQFLNAANQVAACRFSTIAATDSIVDMTPGGSSTLEHCTFSSGALSGFFITGTGNLVYTDLVNTGLAIDLDPALGVITVGDWKPYAEAGAAPGTGVVKGTACFDSAQFTAVDGFIQATGAIPITFTEDTGSATASGANLNILGGTGIATTGAGSTVTVALTGAVATSYNGDTGTAIPAGNNLQILTGSHLTSTASGSQVLITLDGSVPTDWQMDGATMAQSVAGLMHLVGGQGITTTGNGSNTITIDGVAWTDRAVSTVIAGDVGTFATAAITMTLQAGTSQGETANFVATTAAVLVVQAGIGQKIRIGNQVSSSGGTATSTDVGDALNLTFQVATLTWQANSVIGNWTLA